MFGGTGRLTPSKVASALRVKAYKTNYRLVKKLGLVNSNLMHINREYFSRVKKHNYLYRRGPVKYAFRCLYELDSLAVVNVRDVGGCKNAFKVLMFPDTRVFQAENPKAKVSVGPHPCSLPTLP